MQVPLVPLRNSLRHLDHALLHAARFLSLKFLVIPIHERRGDPENIFRQILGDVNEIDGDFNDVVISTFKVDLPTEHGLWKYLTGKPVTNVHQLMDRIDKYKRVEEDQQQGKGKGKVIPQEMRDFRLNCYNNNRTLRDFAGAV